MKASELIKELQECMNLSGDVNVEIISDRKLLKIDKVSSEHWNNIIFGKIPTIIIKGSQQ